MSVKVLILEDNPVARGFLCRVVSESFSDVSGIVEHEICPVFLGRIDADALRPDPDEVADVAWVAWPDVVAAATATPMLLSPWAAEQIRLLDELGVVPASR